MEINQRNYLIASSKEITEIIMRAENIELSRIECKKLSFKVQNDIILKNKQELSPFYELITDLSYSVDSSYPILRKTKPPFLMRSFQSTFYIILPLLFFLLAMHRFFFETKFDFQWILPLITLTGTLFFGFFAYNYIAFNNKWRYVADLYNKIYIDSFHDDETLEFFRKKCLLSQDILDLNLHKNHSFEFEFNKNLTLACLVYDKFIDKNSSSFQKIDDSTIEFKKDPELVLSKVSALILDTLEFEKSTKRNSEIEKLNGIKACYKRLMTKKYNGHDFGDELDEISKLVS